MNARKSSNSLDDDARAESPENAVNVYAPESNTFSPEDYAVGQVISGRFRVEHVIGIGSMGIVLAARHLELDERVAIKFIRSDMQAVPGVLSRFAREAKAAASIKSEHIAQVFDVGTADGIGPYIVMEYLEGRDLAAVLELEGRLPIRRAVHYVMQACEALAVAHSGGITHRDIKPENLFLTRQGDLERIKLLDFGISKAALTGKVFGDELSSADNACLLGTPLYMSPEQIRANVEIDHRTDIWSLGAVLYELITARSAFVADSVKQVWTRILETPPTPLGAYCPDAPPTLQAVIDRCLEKDPARRFQNVAELAVALLPFAPSRARPYAQRTSSILGTRSDSVLPGPLPSPLPASGVRSSRAPVSASAAVSASGAMPLPLPVPYVRSSPPSAPTVTGSYLALPIPDISAPPVFGRRSSQASSPDASKSQLVAAMAVAGLLGALFMVWFGQRRVEPTASRVDPIAHGATQPWPGEAPTNAEQQPDELSTSRAVLIESQPSGALVSVGGQAIGVTPLSTLLPVGTQQLSIAKPGFVTEQAFLQLDAAPRSAKAVRTRVILQPSPGQPTAAAAPAAAPRPVAIKPARPAPRRAPGRRGEPGRDEPAPAHAEPSPEAVAPVETAPAPPLVEAPPRARLLDEQPRARLLE
ncbi:MAG TPA: serine/threonine-protein kinase [Polyangiaceae bacterium]|nr:serine/threonine-protein kinase [Polyangiaceae bacterium]